MKIDPTNPPGSQVQGLGNAQSASPIRRESEEAPRDQATRTDEAPDDRISLSEASKKAVAELARSRAPGPDTQAADLSEAEAARLAQQTSTQLAQTSASISNQAVQKAVDLFT